jgi:hypothetical protein
VAYWIDRGVDYFQIASSDRFHRGARPEYPWEALEQSLNDYSAAHGVEFLIYGKAAAKLVPSGRVLDNLKELESQGAGLLTAERYCSEGWETASNFLSGTDLPYPRCSEVVVDPQGWVHPCCWYELSPGLFDLTTTDFAAGMERLRPNPLCQDLDRGNVLSIAGRAGIALSQARQIRDRVGDCGLCRLAFVSLRRRPDLNWLKTPPLSDRESAFYGARVAAALPNELL